MPWRDADDDLDGIEYPDDDEADGGEQTAPCPYCQRPVYDDAERCPACGSYLSVEDAGRPARRPWWMVAGVLLCLAVLLGWVVGWP